jgi:hypothetical protein
MCGLSWFGWGAIPHPLYVYIIPGKTTHLHDCQGLYTILFNIISLTTVWTTSIQLLPDQSIDDMRAAALHPEIYHVVSHIGVKMGVEPVAIHI